MPRWANSWSWHPGLSQARCQDSASVQAQSLHWGAEQRQHLCDRALLEERLWNCVLLSRGICKRWLETATS